LVTINYLHYIKEAGHHRTLLILKGITIYVERRKKKRKKAAIIFCIITINIL